MQVAALSKVGVDTSRIRVIPEAKSGMSVAMVDDDSDYGAVIVSGSNLEVTPADVDAAADCIRAASCLVMQYEIPLETVLYAAKFARSVGTKVILNAAPAYPSDAILSETDILIVNEIEAKMLLGIPFGNAEETQKELMKVASPAVRVVTLGSVGLVYATSQDSGFIASHRVTIKDAHGAGDCFVGSFAARLALGDQLREALEYGNAAAAVSVSHAGPRSMVTPELVRKQLSPL